jgi:hypothetical protein
MSDPAQNDALAAEYVLGTLDFDERTQAQALLVIDPEFVAKVRLWERRLGELHLMVEPVEPDGKIWDRIKAKMPPPPPPPEVKPAEPAVEPPTLTPPTPEPATSMPSAAEASGADAMSAATPEPMTPVFDPVAATLPVAPSIPMPAGPGPSLTPSVTPGVLPGSVSSPASILPSSMARPLPGAFADIPPVPGFLTAPPPDSPPPAPAHASAPASAAAAVLAESVPQPAEIARQDRTQGTPRAGTFSRMLAVLMTLVVVALGGLIAAWRFVPEQVPLALHPLELMRSVGITVSGAPARKPAPPESQFDE